jgi:hypothetical protein
MGVRRQHPPLRGRGAPRCATHHRERAAGARAEPVVERELVGRRRGAAVDSSGRREEELARLPGRLQPPARWLLARWPGRIGLRAAAELARIEIFDRAMTIAAQFFTSVFPVVILLGSLAGASGGPGAADQVGDAVDLPPEADQVLHEAMHSGPSCRDGWPTPGAGWPSSWCSPCSSSCSGP